MKHLKPLAFGISVLALAFAASTPARADFALIQFAGGRCEIWWNSADNPWGPGWTKLAIGMPNWDAAEAAYHSARAQGVCL